MSIISNISRLLPKLKKKNEKSIDIKNTIRRSQINFARVKIGFNNRISDVVLKGDIHIGNYNSMQGPGTLIKSIQEPIYIGSFCSFAEGVKIINYQHDYTQLTTSYLEKRFSNKSVPSSIVSKGNLEIGSDVWLGYNVVILPGVHVGHGAVIGANSVVSNDIPPYAICAGLPAKPIKYRFDKLIIGLLLQLEWWEKTEEEIIEIYSMFNKKTNNENEVVAYLESLII